VHREDFQEPESQARIIDALNSFDLQHVVQILPSLLVDEYGAGAGDGENAVPKESASSRGRRRREKANSSGSGAASAGKGPTASSRAAAAVGGTQVADGWTETIREDFDGYDMDKRDWSHLWGTQMETQVECGAEENLDADFPADSDEDVPSRRAGGGGGRSAMLPLDMEILSALSAADTGSGTQVATQWQDSTQCSQPMAASLQVSPVKTRRGSRSQSSSVAPSPRSASGTSSSSCPRRQNATAPSQVPRLETLHEEEETAGTQCTPLISQTLSSPDEHMRAIFDKLAKVPELFATQSAARGNQTQVASRPQSQSSQVPPQEGLLNPTPNNPLGPQSVAGVRPAHSAETPLMLSAPSGIVHLSTPAINAPAGSAPVSQPLSLLDLSASTQSGHSAEAGWLDRHLGILTQEERDSLFDWSSQHASQFLFGMSATAASSGSAGKATDARAGSDSFVCVEGAEPSSSTVPALPAAASAAVIATPAPLGPALFSTQEPVRGAPVAPLRPSKPPVPSPAAVAGAADSQRSSASLLSSSSQATPGQVVMINNNDSAPNQMMMTKTGKMIAFRPASGQNKPASAVSHPGRLLVFLRAIPIR
jgi:hypothetical protein